MSVHKSRYDDEPLFVTWGNEQERMQAFKTASKAVSQPDSVVQRSSASTVFKNIAPGISVRDAISRRDYEYFRIGDARPKRHKDILRDCNEAYRHVGIINNTINLMSDFTVQGIDIAHENVSTQKFYKNWWKRVEGPYVSERFSNLLYRLANVPVKRTWAKTKKESIDFYSTGVKDIRLPWGYNILNPLLIEVLNEDIAPFLGDEFYSFGFRIPEALMKKLKGNSGLASGLRIPSDIKRIVDMGKSLIPLQKEDIDVYYYKKDDWQVWAEPMLFSILDDLKNYEKLKLADMAALDGAISHIRIWRLGDITNKILPTSAAVNRLSDMLMNNGGGGPIDLIWGPDLQLQETSTEVYKFLGNEKYGPTLNAIYAGLGIPPTLTGGEGSKGGFTNNFISLRTLTERLNYGRTVLSQFWQKEIRLVQEAMGFAKPAQLVFDRPTLSDEATELTLLVQLWDRGIISDESVRDRFNFLPNLEDMRIKREEKKRESGVKLPKTGPYHSADKTHELSKIALQQGNVTPSEVGLNLKQRKSGEIPVLDKQLRSKKADNKTRMEQLNPKGQSGQGRPKGMVDMKKRKQKVVKPRSKAALEFINNLGFAKQLQKNIADIINPIFLQMKSKANLRQLNNEDANSLERLKFNVLCNIELGSIITEELIFDKMTNKLSIPIEIDELLTASISKFREEHDSEPSIEDIKHIQASVYSLYCTDFNGDEDGEISS